MKETRFIVHISEKGYVNKVNKDGEWSFTKNLKECLQFKTLTGAYTRLKESKKISEFANLDSSILIIETTDNKLNIISKLNYILNKKTPFTDNKVLKQNINESEKNILVSSKKTANKVHTNNIIQNKIENTIVKKKDPIQEINIVESKLNVKVLKSSVEDSFWE